MNQIDFLFHPQPSGTMKQRQLAALREPDSVNVHDDTCVIVGAKKGKEPWSIKPWYRVKSLAWLYKLRALYAIKKKVIKVQVHNKCALQLQHEQEMAKVRAFHADQMRRLENQQCAEMAEMNKMIDWHLAATKQFHIYRDPPMDDPIDINDIPF